MTKTKYPKGFYAHSAPRFYGFKPNKMIPAYTELSKVSVSDGDELIFEEGKRYKISLDHDYGNCYYPDDTPSIVANLVQFSEEDIENTNYDSELSEYNNAKKKHSEDLKTWKKWKAICDKKQSDAKEKAERQMLNKLKEKYEK